MKAKTTYKCKATFLPYNGSDEKNGSFMDFGRNQKLYLKEENSSIMK